MRRRGTAILGAVALAGSMVTLSCAKKKDAPPAKSGEVTAKSKAGKANARDAEAAPVERAELKEPEPFLEYTAFRVRQTSGFEDPMRPLVMPMATPTPTGLTAGGPEAPSPDKVEKPPDWVNLKGIVWDNKDPSKSVAVFVDPGDWAKTISGAEGEAVLPMGEDPEDEVIIKTIWPTGVMLLYRGQEFSQLLPEDLVEEQSKATSGKKSAGRRPARRGGRR